MWHNYSWKWLKLFDKGLKYVGNDEILGNGQNIGKWLNCLRTTVKTCVVYIRELA